MFFIYPLKEWNYISQKYWTLWNFNRGLFHRGIDYVASYGTPIYASQSGFVKREGRRYDYGNYIEVDIGDGFTYLNAHMEARSLKNVGDRVEIAVLIGRVGSTGKSTGAHDHFELRYNGIKVNPEKYNFLTYNVYMDLQDRVQDLEGRTGDLEEDMDKRPTEAKVLRLIEKEFKSRIKNLKLLVDKIRKKVGIKKPRLRLPKK